MPDSPQGDEEHGDVGEGVEGGGENVEDVFVEAAAFWVHGFVPDLGARAAEEDGDEEEDDVEDYIEAGFWGQGSEFWFCFLTEGDRGCSTICEGDEGCWGCTYPLRACRIQ